MRRRTTEALLQNRVDLINAIVDKSFGEIGSYELGCNSLDRVVNDGGGTTDIFHFGSATGRGILQLLQAFRMGLEEQRRIARESLEQEIDVFPYGDHQC